MVEVTIKVEGEDAHVAGDSLRCLLILRNTLGEPQTIAWVGGRIHCQCLLKEAFVKLKPSPASVSSPVNDTAFFPNRGEKGHCVLSTQSSVLLCNVTINPAETKTVSYEETIPAGGPPSFHGHLVRYIYKLAIGFQKSNCPVQITRIPIKVIKIPDHFQRPLMKSPIGSNPFLINEDSQSSIELGLEAIAVEACKRNLSSYTLTAAGDTLGRVVIPRTSYRAGDDVTAIFDCSQSAHPVVQVTASLVCVETIEGDHVISGTLKPVVTIVSHQTKSCTNSLITHYSLPIPSTLTQTFSNDTVKIHWEIQFHLLISRGSWTATHVVEQSVGPGGGVAEVWSGPLQHHIDTIDWSLTVTVLPTLYWEQSAPQQTLTL